MRLAKDFRLKISLKTHFSVLLCALFRITELRSGTLILLIIIQEDSLSAFNAGLYASFALKSPCEPLNRMPVTSIILGSTSLPER